VKDEMSAWFVTQQLKTFFSEGKQKLVDCWTKCAEKVGDSIEK
jgi:hypothetical protein